MEVSPGQPMTMRSPRPAVLLTSCLCSPVPKASIRLMPTVPHTMPKTVRKVRSFSARTSRMSWRKTSLRVTMGCAALRDLLRRPLHHLVALLQAGEHFHVQAVGDAGLDLGLLRRGLRVAAGQLHGGLLAAVLECDEALGDGQHVLLLADDDVGIGGVAGAQRDLLIRLQLDLDVEQRGAFLLLRLRRDARDA